MSEIFPELGDYLHAHFPELADSLGFPAPVKKGLPGAEMRAATPDEMNASTLAGQMRQADPSTAAMMSLPQPVSDAVDRIGSIAGAARELGANAQSVDEKPFQMALTAFHGSPHKFDAFDIKKLGSGEGAQAYGHGLYFAENPAVAKEYMHVNPSVLPPPRRVVMGAEVAPGSPEYHAATLLTRSGETLASARKEVEGWIANARPGENVEHYQKVLETLNSAKSKKDFKELAPHKYLYKVDIPDDQIERMLDWEKPLSEQGDIAAKIREIASRGDPIDGADMGGGAKLRFNHNGEFDRSKPYPYVLEVGDSRFGLSESDVKRMYGNVDTLTGEQAYQRLATALGSQEKASEYLRSVGIPGTKYFDAGSRSAREGTRNFVVFDDKIIKVLDRTNGK